MELETTMFSDYERAVGHVWEFALPKFANSGENYQWAQDAWREDARVIAGGLTVMPEAQGSWRDPADGKVYNDVMIGHRVMCGEAQAEKLLKLAFKYFADQKAIFVTRIGAGYILTKPEDDHVS